LRRGDIVPVAPAGEFGKPRPAVVLQADLPAEYITYLPVTSDLKRVPNVRIPIEPTAANGLRSSSEIMVDMIQTSSMGRFRQIIGSVDSEILKQAEASLSLHLGLDG